MSSDPDINVTSTWYALFVFKYFAHALCRVSAKAPPKINKKVGSATIKASFLIIKLPPNRMTVVLLLY